MRIYIFLFFFDYIHTHIKSHHLFLIVIPLADYLEKKTTLTRFFFHLPHQSSLVLMQKKSQIPNGIINKIGISITKEGHAKRKKNQDR